MTARKPLSITMNSAELLRMIRNVSVARCLDPYAWQMDGIHIRIRGSEIVCEATDRYRICMQTYLPNRENDEAVTGNKASDFLLAGSDLPLITGLLARLKNDKTALNVTLTENVIGDERYVTVTGGDYVLQLKLASGEYPKIDRLIPDTFDGGLNRIGLNPAFLGAMTRIKTSVSGLWVANFSNGETKPVVWKHSGDASLTYVVMPLRLPS